MAILTRQRTLARISPYETIRPTTIIYYSGLLWLAPLVCLSAWLSIPLSLDGEHLHLGLFLTWRALYHQVTTGLTIVVVCIGLPTPSLFHQALVCVVSLLVGLGSDALITFVETDWWRQQLLRSTPVLTGGPIFLGLYFAVRSAFFAEQDQQVPFLLEGSLSSLPSDAAVNLLTEPDTDHMRSNINNKAIKEYTIEELNRQFFLRLVASFLIIGLYLTCVYYRVLTEYLFTSELLKSASVVLFSVALYPWSFALSLLAEKLDKNIKGDTSRPSYQALFIWICLLFENYFIRELFFDLTDYYEVVMIALINVAKLAVRFPLRMSRRWWEFKRFFNVYILQKPSRSDFEEDLAEFRLREIVTFYFLCMAERISLTTFTIGYAVIHHNFNRKFFEQSLPDHEFEKLLGFCGYVLAVEWAGSTILTLVIRHVYSLNALTRGGYVVCSPYFRLCALYTAVHICSDYYASALTTEWSK